MSADEKTMDTSPTATEGDYSPLMIKVPIVYKETASSQSSPSILSQ